LDLLWLRGKHAGDKSDVRIVCVSCRPSDKSGLDEIVTALNLIVRVTVSS
jgi:hypothetical protein